MNVHYTSHFVKGFKALPRQIKTLALEKENIFRQNCRDPRLHLKPLKGRLKGLFSFRVTRNYRILLSWQDQDNVLFYEIGDRKFIYD